MGTKPTGDQIGEHAISLWPKIAARAGFSADAYTPILLAARPIPGDARAAVLLRAKGQLPDMVLKAEFQPKWPERFRNQVKNLRNAHEILAKYDTLRVPKVYWADEKTECQLIEFVPGQTVHTIMEMADLGLADRSQVLRHCGQWMGAYHANSFTGFSLVNPDYMMDRFNFLNQQVEAREIQVPRRGFFLECAAKMLGIAQAARGKQTRICAAHGDMHLHNLLIDGPNIYGIDFRTKQNTPSAHDVSLFLVRFGGLFFNGSNNKPERASYQADMTAFYTGYGDEFRDDPALKYLYPLQILHDWANIEKDRTQRNAVDQKRLRGLLRMAMIVFQTPD